MSNIHNSRQNLKLEKLRHIANKTDWKVGNCLDKYRENNSVMSCEDSLSQSILEPNEVLTKQSQSSILLLDEVESLQNEILKDIDEQCMSLAS